MAEVDWIQEDVYMTKGTTDNVLYFYHVIGNKWKGLVFETIIQSNIEGSPTVGKSSVEVLKDCANELGIEVEELADGAYEFKRGNETRRIRNSASLEIAFTNWLCGNKYATFEILKKYGFQKVPCYRRYSLNTIREAREDFLMRNKAVVIKPCSRTSGGIGVTVAIRNMRQLNRAIFISLRHDDNYLMEDFIEGDHFRLLFFKDRMLDAVQRLPANIKGDGINNIRQLIRIENERRAKERSSLQLNPILINNDVKQTLLNKKMSFNHVPTKGETVYVMKVCNSKSGGETRDITSFVHPDIVRDCGRVMRIMDITIGGIDIITKDISKPLAETGGVINEVNTSAGLDIHEKAVSMNLLNLMFEKNLQTKIRLLSDQYCWSEAGHSSLVSIESDCTNLL